MRRGWLLALGAITCGILDQNNPAAGPNFPKGDPGGQRFRAATVEVAPDSMRLGKGEVSEAQCYPRNRVLDASGKGQLLADPCAWVSRDTTIATLSTGGTQITQITARKAGRVWIVTWDTKATAK
jgi:hypothetical protein